MCLSELSIIFNSVYSRTAIVKLHLFFLTIEYIISIYSIYNIYIYIQCARKLHDCRILRRITVKRTRLSRSRGTSFRDCLGGGIEDRSPRIPASPCCFGDVHREHPRCRAKYSNEQRQADATSSTIIQLAATIIANAIFAAT